MSKATSPRVDPLLSVLSRTIWAICLAPGKVMAGSLSATWAVVRERCSSRPCPWSRVRCVPSAQASMRSTSAVSRWD